MKYTRAIQEIKPNTNHTKDIKEIKVLVRAMIEEVRAVNAKSDKILDHLDKFYVVTGVLTIGLLLSIFFI